MINQKQKELITLKTISDQSEEYLPECPCLFLFRGLMSFHHSNCVNHEEKIEVITRNISNYFNKRDFLSF